MVLINGNPCLPSTGCECHLLNFVRADIHEQPKPLPKSLTPSSPLIGEEDLQRSRIEFIVTLVVTFSHENGITTDIQEITIGIGKAGNYEARLVSIFQERERVGPKGAEVPWCSA